MFEMILFGLVCLSGVTILVCRYGYPELAKREPEPWYLDYARSFFPVLLIVFLLRGFIAEPFRIPSGSMYPTLEVGDFILVNKFAYGVRLPILQTKVIELDDPDRGDIVVFKYPKDPSQNYIKRLIGLPGDRIDYLDKVVYLNGERVAQVEKEFYQYLDQKGNRLGAMRYEQTIPIGGDSNDVAAKFSTLLSSPPRRGSRRSWVVPEGQYFMMGDNRDNSQDSRSWGFLPDKNVVGKAFFIWMSWGNEDNEKGGGIDFDRIGANIEAERVGAGAN